MHKLACDIVCSTIVPTVYFNPGFFHILTFRSKIQLQFTSVYLRLNQLLKRWVARKFNLISNCWSSFLAQTTQEFVQKQCRTEQR